MAKKLSKAQKIVRVKKMYAELNRPNCHADASETIDALKTLGFYENDLNNYDSEEGKACAAIFETDDGMFVELDYTWDKVPRKRDSWVAGKVLLFNYWTSVENFFESEHYYPRGHAQEDNETKTYRITFRAEVFVKAKSEEDALEIYGSHDLFSDEAKEELDIDWVETLSCEQHFG